MLFLVGLLCGACVGVTIMALCIAAKDRHKKWNQKSIYIFLKNLLTNDWINVIICTVNKQYKINVKGIKRHG